MSLKKMRESLKRSIDEMFQPLQDMIDEMRVDMTDFDDDLKDAEKTVTVEETKENGVVTKVVTRTVYRSRKL